jgi:hypothetical protein
VHHCASGFARQHQQTNSQPPWRWYDDYLALSRRGCRAANDRLVLISDNPAAFLAGVRQYDYVVLKRNIKFSE